MKVAPLTAWVAAFAMGCAAAPHGWDARPLEGRYPALAEVRGHRLVDSPPYFALAPDGVALFLCHWAGGTEIPVWLPPTARPAETAALERALDAWEGAGLGVSFRVGTWRDAPPLAGIVFELLDADPEVAPPGTGTTIADCAIPPEVASGPPDASDTPVDAELQHASIQLWRSYPDLLGRPVPVSETELVGAALHELGHALGFPGHVGSGGSVMSGHGQIDAARRWGRRVEAGETLEAPTLAALYAVPSGARVGWMPLERGQLARAAQLRRRAVGAGLRGPWVRVGAVSARLLYRDDPGSSYAAVVLDWAAALRDPARFQAHLNRRARLLLDESPR